MAATSVQSNAASSKSLLPAVRADGLQTSRDGSLIPHKPDGDIA